MLLKILICHAVDLTTLYTYPDKLINIEMNCTLFFSIIKNFKINLSTGKTQVSSFLQLLQNYTVLGLV